MTAKSQSKIDAEKKLADTPYEESINPDSPTETVDALDPYAPANLGMGPGPVSPPIEPTFATVSDIPANMPYPTGDPKTPQTWEEINGLAPKKAPVEAGD